MFISVPHDLKRSHTFLSVSAKSVRFVCETSKFIQLSATVVKRNQLAALRPTVTPSNFVPVHSSKSVLPYLLGNSFPRKSELHLFVTICERQCSMPGRKYSLQVAVKSTVDYYCLVVFLRAGHTILLRFHNGLRCI